MVTRGTTGEGWWEVLGVATTRLNDKESHEIWLNGIEVRSTESAE